MTGAPPADCDLAIVICTFHREELLAKALASLNAQRAPEGLRVRVLVIDNSDEGSAASVVAAAAAQSPFEMRGIATHPANISVARNAGVAAASAEFIAFIDDDQELNEGWLEAAAHCIADAKFDAFFGAVDSMFETPERATPLVRQLFSRRLREAEGFELFALGPRKTGGITLATSNSIFRRSAIPDLPAPFDEHYGHGGGEDYDLICRMQRRGSRFAWAPDMKVSEFVPASRCDAAYLRQRFFAGGQAYAAAAASSTAARWALRAKAVVQACILAPQLPIKIWRGREAFADYSYVWAGVLGKISLGAIHPIYRL